MLIVITSEEAIKDEAFKINQLFEHGLEQLHIRKPFLDFKGYKDLLNKINSKYYKKIIIHQYHELVETLDLGGVHLQEQKRLALGNTLKIHVNKFIKKGYKITSSFHTKSDLENISVGFSYVFLSPVFDAISKSNYKGKNFDVSSVNAFVIGLGVLQN
ncbi:thiamine phosphate synthase [Tritonibacter mobilis]|nr:thiamine phosphate synthase [Tritonibacter mobilis]